MESLGKMAFPLWFLGDLLGWADWSAVVMSNRVQRGFRGVLLIGVVLWEGWGGVWPARALFLSRTFFELKLINH